MRIFLKNPAASLIFLSKDKKLFLDDFFGFFAKMRIFLKNSAASVFALSDPPTSQTISEKSYKLFLRKTVY